MKIRRRTFIAVPAVLSFGALLPAGATERDPAPTPPPVDDTVPSGEEEYLALPALPQGGSDPGVEGVTRSAIRLAAALRAVPAERGATESCPEDRLVVGWDEPGPTYGHGAFVDPVGPAPTAGTTAVNGVVRCTGSDWAFMGFEAKYVHGRWDVVAVPFVDEQVGDEGHEHERDSQRHATGQSATAIPPVSEPRSFSGAIDAYARYEPQRTCSPSAKPGALALQRLLMGGAPGSRNLGISRACHIGGSSEHKEGRAFDWGVLVRRPAERATADEFLARLLATDAAGNRHALARRMGVMYVIWNQRIWSAYRPNDGWRPYSGRSPHTDHVHISLSWDGALGRTSYWSGQPVEALSFGPATGRRVATAPSTMVAAPPPTSRPAAPAPTPGTAPSRDHGTPDDGARRAAEEETRRAQKAAEEEARRQQQVAAEEARRVQQVAAEEAHRQQKAADEAARRAQKAAEEQARRAEKAVRDAARRPREVMAASPAPVPPAAPGGGGGKARGRGGR